MASPRPRSLRILLLLGCAGLALPLAWWLALEVGTGLSGIWWGLSLGLACVAVSLVYWIRAFGPAHDAHAPAPSGLQGDTEEASA